jgi:hypothetical protein
MNIVQANAETRAIIEQTALTYPAHLRAIMDEAGIRAYPLAKGEKYIVASGELSRLSLDVDRWPAPLSGLFVVAERTLYLRQPEPMTIAHELGHALDCALGEGVYLSSKDARFGEAFRAAKRFVTPYAASGVDEYFAEGARAMVEVNELHSLWPMVTRAALERKDPTLFALLSDIFSEEGKA